MHWITFLVALVGVWACVVGQGDDSDSEEETSYRTTRLPTTATATTTPAKTTTTRTMVPKLTTSTTRTTTKHSHMLSKDVGCHTGADCGKSQCCQELDAALYVHGRDIADVKPSVRSFPGICVPMGGTAYDCHPHVPYAWNKPEGLVQLCPCKTGLICGRIHLRDKFGVKGICSFG